MDQRWRQEAEAVLTGFKEWRRQHPRATCTEIKAALDARLAGMRARLLEDAALASAARPRCPELRAADGAARAGDAAPDDDL